MIQLQEVEQKYDRGFLAVDLDAIVENMQNMKGNISENTKMIGVIKTNGYGHGSVPIAKVLEPLDFMYGFAVATFEEAVELRRNGIKKPLLILGYSFPYCYEDLAELDVRPAVFRRDMLTFLNQAAEKVGKKIKVHVKVDTGMSRIGIRPDESGLDFVRELLSCEYLELEGIFTHFAKADEYDKTGAMKQLGRFRDFIRRIEESLQVKIPVKHCSNSAGILEIKDANMDVVRAGITLYGLAPSGEVDMNLVPLRPAMSLYSHVVFVKDLFPGEAVSYGGTFVADKTMRVATIPLGYGDGYPRSLSNKGYVLIHGRKAPILGRVCMDQFMVDVSDIAGVKEGDLVTLLGRDGEESITAENLGEVSGRFNYELVCDFSKRIPRLYFKDGHLISTDREPETL